MKKRIVVCADGTWNRPEEDLERDVPTNVLRVARAIRPFASDGTPQQVFYDWGIGSYYDQVVGGATGKGINKNIMDDYRYIVQNYRPGDEVFLFGFSRGAYTVRSLSGLINNCGILKRPDARLIQRAFEIYKTSSKKYAPDGSESMAFREAHAHGPHTSGSANRKVAFMGVWDTVGALGVPFSVMGLLDPKDEFYDTKIGRNVGVACHAMAIDELRSDFEPTVIAPRDSDEVHQVWFAGAHSDVGGGLERDDDGSALADLPLGWMIKRAAKCGLAVEAHLKDGLTDVPTAKLHPSRTLVYRFRPKYVRPIDHGNGEVLIHRSVKERWASDSDYRPKNLVDYLGEEGDWAKANLVD